MVDEIKNVRSSAQVLEETKKIVHEDNVQLTRLYFAWHSEKGYGR